MFRFLSFSARCSRALRRGLSGSLLSVRVVVAVVLLPWCLSVLLLRRLLFVRFPRPRWSPPGAPRSSRCWASWVCVPPSSLPSLRASSLVWAVRPAVVARRSGAVLRVWAFCSWAPVAPTSTPVGGRLGGGSAAALPAAAA